MWWACLPLSNQSGGDNGVLVFDRHGIVEANGSKGGEATAAAGRRLGAARGDLQADGVATPLPLPDAVATPLPLLLPFYTTPWQHAGA